MMNFVARHRRLFAFLILADIVGVLVAIAVVQYTRPIPDVTLVESASLNWTPPQAAEIAWPESGQAVLAVDGVGVIGESPNQQPSPIASLTKVMTAYVILKNHPLAPGDPGPEVEFQDQDVVNYQTRLSNSESVVPVSAGGKMTEIDLLRGLLIASANNLADVLATWDAGSVEAFVNQMNAEAQALGMTNTTYADAAGLLPGSASTAHDQLLLAQAAMADPIFAAIVRQPQATLPGAGVVYNTDAALSSGDIIGIKTGWTEEAGACFLFAAEWDVNGQTQRIMGAVLGQVTLQDAFDRSRELILLGGSSMNMVALGSQGDTVGQLKTDWGDVSDAVLADNVSVLIVPGMNVNADLQLTEPEKITPGSEVGSIEYSAGDQHVSVPVLASSAVGQPDIMWRLTRLP
jgi:D-alanyl-D-alanine carboxypeptidase (penicillin-binding protein 5/6)